MRGIVDPPEDLDADGQAAAYWQMAEDYAREKRVNFELYGGMDTELVMWNRRKPPARDALERSAHVDRMLAAAAAGARGVRCRE